MLDQTVALKKKADFCGTPVLYVDCLCVCLLQESSRYSSTTYYFSYDMAGVEPHRPWGVDGHGESPMAGRGIGVGWAFGVDLWDV